MLGSKDDLNNEFWRLLKQFRGVADVNSLKNYLLTLIFLKFITEENKELNSGNLILPSNSDFDSLIALGNSNNLGNEINTRLNAIAKANPVLEGVINYVDFNNHNIFGRKNESATIFRELLLSINSLGTNTGLFSSSNKSIWSDQFDNLLKIFSETNSKAAGDFSTPKAINELIRKLINVSSKGKNISIYDPTCGAAGLLISVAKELGDNVHLFGQEINSDQVFLAKLNLCIHGIENFQIEGGDVLNSPQFVENGSLKKFDYVVANPPFGMRIWNHRDGDDIFNRWNSNTGIPPTNSADYAFLLHIINSLKENGRAACIVSNGVLFRGGSERNIRKYLLESGYIKGIIGLPEKLFFSTGIPCSIIILENKPSENRDGIFIIDASKEYLSERFINKLMPENIYHIADVWENGKEENEFSRNVPHTEIAENDYNLNLPRYLATIDNFEGPEGSNLVELSNVLASVPRIRTNNESGKLIKISDLLNDSFLYTIAIDSLAEDTVNRAFNKLTSPALLISKRFNKLKPSFIEASLDYPVFISPDIDAFTINNDLVDLSYLIIQLSSDFVTKQAESFSLGTAMPNIKKDDLLKIKIVIPNLETQDSIIRQKALAEGARIQSDKGKIETFQLQATIDTLLKERMNDFQWKLHDIRNGELLNLKGQIVTLEMFADTNPEMFNNIVDQESNDTVHSSIKDIYTSVQKLAVILSDLYDTSENASIKEDIDVLVFIKEFCDNQLKSNGNLFEIDLTDIDKTKEDFEIKDLVISVNKKDVKRIFTNIFENAIKHGGFKDLKQANKIKMALSLDSKEEIITIAVLNNGKPSKINAMDYFSDGGKAGSASNSGKGGHIVKVLTERNNGKVFQNNYAIDEANGYTFEVGVQFKYKLSYEL